MVQVKRCEPTGLASRAPSVRLAHVDRGSKHDPDRSLTEAPPRPSMNGGTKARHRSFPPSRRRMGGGRPKTRRPPITHALPLVDARMDGDCRNPYPPSYETGVRVSSTYSAFGCEYFGVPTTA